MSAGLQLEIKATGVAEIRRALRQIARKSGNLRVPFEAAGRYLVTRTHEHFQREESPEGEPWKALSTAYVMKPKKEGGRGGLEHPILFRTGHLLNSITYRADNKGFAVGTNRKFPGGNKSAAAIHQLGGIAGHGAHIPARPFLGVNDEDWHRINEFLIEYLSKL